MSGRKATGQNAVQRVLNACQAFGRVVVLIMNMQIIVVYSFQYLVAQQIVVYKRFGGFTGKLHHHARRSIGIHIGIFPCHIVGLDLYNLQKHITRLGFAGNATLVAVSNILLCHIFPATFHQLHFYCILNGFHRHLCTSLERYVICDLAYQLQVFTFVRV